MQPIQRYNIWPVFQVDISCLGTPGPNFYKLEIYGRFPRYDGHGHLAPTGHDLRISEKHGDDGGGEERQLLEM